MIFVNSMSDLFHEEVPDAFIRDVFEVMNRVDRHVYQVLTKRPQRMLDLASDLEWSANIWAGVTVETEEYTERLDHLREVQVGVRFVSFEPLLGPIGDVNLADIDWVIVGGESGPGARIMKPEWAHALRDACLDAGVPFFFKQWGGVQKKRAGRLLEGRTWDQMPTGAMLSL
jgi:protein gp37